MARSSLSALVVPGLRAVPERRGPAWLPNALRHTLPVAGVVIVIVLVVVIAYFVYESNRRGAAALGNDLVTAIDRRVAVQMHSYLSLAQEFLRVADAAADGQGVFGDNNSTQQLALHALGTIAPVTAFSYADPAGNFLFVVRNDKGGFDTKIVDRRNGGHVVTWTRRDAKN